ncbi:MAG: N-acetylneuraminate synthase [Anaerolineaceae bacterium]
MKTINISGRRIGSGEPCFIIAEAGVNHNGSVELARRLVDAAADAGADAVKFQTFQAGKLVTALAKKAAYQQEATGPGESQLEMLQKLELPLSAYPELISHCQERKIQFISTPFDEESTELLISLGMPVLKVPSGEVTNLPFLQFLARKALPMLVSTGMATLGEIENAVQVIRSAGRGDFILLHCVTNYPTPPEEVNLRVMNALASAFEVPVGYSDHTRGIEIPLAAAALGACVIEKHFTLDRTMEGPDHKASLNPVELAALVRGIRIIEASLGSGVKKPSVIENETAMLVRRSLIAACDIPVGLEITLEMVAIKRPGSGLPPAMLQYVLGRKTRQAIPAGSLLALDMF